MGVPVALSDVFAKGGEGGVELAKKVVELADSGKADFKPLYDLEMSLKQKSLRLPRKFTELKMWNTARTPRKL
jgi:formate--tetrahydrofolate ligase